MIRRRNAGRTIFLRYIITNLLILVIPFLTTTVYYFVSLHSIEKSVDAIAEVQLEGSVSYVDRKLQDLEEHVSNLIVDYEVNRYLNNTGTFTDIELYNMKRVSERLSSIVLGGEFLSRSFLYLTRSDKIIFESGFSDYSLFYGPLFEVEGFDAASWKEIMIKESEDIFTFLPRYQSSAVGKLNLSHFYIQQIGRGDFRRGAFVAVIDAKELGRHLAKLPELYGGWFLTIDSEDRLIASSNQLEGDNIAKLYSSLDGASVLHVDGKRYRIYSRNSTYNNWRYIALMNEERIIYDVIRVRNQAFTLLGIGFLVGIILSYGMAFSNSKPLTSLFSLLKLPTEESSKHFAGVYTRVEKAILSLSDSKHQLEKEVLSVVSTSQTYFLQNLLRGEYRDRVLFSGDRDRFRVNLASGYYYVLVCRLSPLALALDSQRRGIALTVLLKILSDCITSEEYALRSSSGALVAILHPKYLTEYKREANDFVNNLLNKLDVKLQGAVLFGVGTPVDNPFLLPISFSEAEAAYGAIGPEQRLPLYFYEDFPAPVFSYLYPFHVEEAIFRAVRAANVELLNSLLEGIRKENFINRTLSPQEAGNLVLALRGTALRIQTEFPKEMSHFGEMLNGLTENQSVDKAFKDIASVLFSMADIREQGKHSHNANLAFEIREYVLLKFRNFNLGLASIAETFNLSENYLSSFFKEQEGECLSVYIQNKRMTEASSLLLTRREISISSIAADCGYPNASSFRRAFKRVYGLSPSEYRVRNTLKAKKGISMINRTEIQLRDPFLLPQADEGLYYLFGTTDSDPWGKTGRGFDFYTSKDLENWKGPFAAFRPDKNFWGTYNFWAPEVHYYGGAYYMFATFKSVDHRRGTQILRSDRVIGPYFPHSPGPVTPSEWECLDGTLYVDENSVPWIIFCHEWVQVNDGEVCALRLSKDLKQAEGDSVLLFRGAEAPWTKKLPRRDGSSIVDARVTDGPFLYNTSAGGLLLLWSSVSKNGYALGVARSESGSLFGPWIQSEHPVFDSDGGHGMVFQSFEGRLFLSYHSPNNTPKERFRYIEIIEQNGTLVLAG